MKVSVFSNPSKDMYLSNTFKLLCFLKSYKADIFMSVRCYDEVRTIPVWKQNIEGNFKITVLPEQTLFTSTDFGIVLGGDGTILRVAKRSAGTDFHIMGINLGKVGYIAELEMNELDLLKDVLKCNTIEEYIKSTNCVIDNRMLLSVDIIQNSNVVYSSTVLNDAVISKGSVSKMINIDVLCNSKKMTSYRADGIIVSTPTGSTAYSMSAGGPLIDPTIECICSVPVCPYLCLNRSPVIYSDASVIDIVYHEQKGSEAYLTVDGKGGKKLCDGDVVRIKKCPHKAKLLRLKNIDFYKLLNMKMSKTNEN